MRTLLIANNKSQQTSMLKLHHRGLDLYTRSWLELAPNEMVRIVFDLPECGVVREITGLVSSVSNIFPDHLIPEFCYEIQFVYTFADQAIPKLPRMLVNGKLFKELA